MDKEPVSYKVGDTIQLSDNKRDLFLNKIGGLNVEILEFEDTWGNFKVTKVKIIATGNTTKILL
jgi:hypothetical protein